MDKTIVHNLVTKHNFVSFFSKWAKNIFVQPIQMVFCYQNCSDLLWEKIVLVIEKEFAKILKSLEQFIQAVKG